MKNNDSENIKKIMNHLVRFEKEVNGKFDAMDGKFDAMDYKLNIISDKINKHDEKLNDIHTSIDYLVDKTEKLDVENSAGAYNQRQITDTIVDHETRITNLELAKN